MKKSLLIGCMVAWAGFGMSQVVEATNFENWTAGAPNGWMGDKSSITLANVSEITGNAMYGTKVVRLQEPTTAHKRFSTQDVSITLNTTYTVEVWVKGQGEIRVGLHNGGAYQTYSPYTQINGASNQLVTQTVIATASSTQAQFILSVVNTVGPAHIEIDSVHISAAVVGPPSTVSLSDIQFTAAGGTSPSPLAGQLVNTGGIVMTAPFTNSTLTGFFIQDGAGAWNGILVESTEAVTPGDSITFTGLVQESFGFTIITNLTNFTAASSGNPLYPFTPINTTQVNQEQFESVLVKVTDAQCTNANSGFGQWEVNDGSGASLIGNGMYQYAAQQLGTEYDITGVVYYSFSEFKLLPRFVADVVVSNTPPPTTTTIYDIQFTTDPSGDSPFVGLAVTTSGIVTAVANNSFILQDGSGPWSGVEVYDPSTNVQRGDSVLITGTVTEYFGMTQVHQLTNKTIVSSGNTVPAPTIVLANVISEMYEGVLIRVENAICTNANAGFNMFQISDASGAVLVDDKFYQYTATLGQAYNVDGVINFAFGNFRISPRDINDIDPITSVSSLNTESIRLYPNPATDKITLEGLKKGSFVIRDVLGNTVMDGTISTENSTIHVSHLRKGVYFVQTENKTFRFVKQ